METKYEDDYNEQLDKVNELEAKIEIAKRDTSLAGQKRLADLMEQLKDEQENLEDLVEDKIDEDINNMFDDEKDRIEKISEPFTITAFFLVKWKIISSFITCAYPLIIVIIPKNDIL